MLLTLKKLADEDNQLIREAQDSHGQICMHGDQSKDQSIRQRDSLMY